MIKDRKYNVHPNVLGILLHLRLKSELRTRASETKTEPEPKSHPKQRKSSQKKGDGVHLSKKAKKALKEKRAIQKEFQEAEAQVDEEERAAKASFRPVYCVY
jgi:nucleolar complex protein 3